MRRGYRELRQIGADERVSTQLNSIRACTESERAPLVRDELIVGLQRRNKPTTTDNSNQTDNLVFMAESPFGRLLAFSVLFSEETSARTEQYLLPRSTDIHGSS